MAQISSPRGSISGAFLPGAVLRRSRKAEARSLLEEALAILRSLAIRSPDVYQPDIAETLEQALAEFRELAVRAPATYQRRVQEVEQHLATWTQVGP